MSFDPSLPGVRDRLRLQLGDTSGNAATELFPDTIYDATLAYNGNDEIKTVVALAEALIAKFSQAATRINLGDMEFSWRDRLKSWSAVVEKFAGVASAEAGGGFNILRAEREEDHSEYERPYTMEAWWTDP